MVPSRASDERELTALSYSPQAVVSNPAPAADSSSQAILLTRLLAQDARWIGGAMLLYGALVVVTVLKLHPYFAQTWDVVTFINAGKSALSSDWAGLYAQSRADRYWPYAYPPLHAFVVAPFVAGAGLLPEWLMVRVMPLLCDVALGVLLYIVVMQKTRVKNLARAAMAVWLLNPVTWYDTAVQGHFEAEWLFFVALAYFLYETRKHWIWVTLSLAIAFLFKQNAVLFALPFWALLFFNSEKNFPQRVLSLLASLVTFAIPVILVSLPFLLRSNDYWFMNVQYVAAVPLQTQSWLVGAAGMWGAENLFLRASSLLTLIAAALISFFGARRGMSLWLMSLLITLSFFLLSKKVVGYYYVMLLPFALVTLIPAKRFRLLALIVAATAFIFVSPYFASWAKQTHWWLYALLGLANSALWFGIFIWLWRRHPLAEIDSQSPRAVVFVSVALFFAACAAALLQPFISSQTSPIRAPLIAPENESIVFFSFLAFTLLVFLSLVLATYFARPIARAPRIWAGFYALVVLLAPLYFLTFTLTKEATAGLEMLLETFGL